MEASHHRHRLFVMIDVGGLLVLWIFGVPLFAMLTL
jgi:hypothetical protein